MWGYGERTDEMMKALTESLQACEVATEWKSITSMKMVP